METLMGRRGRRKRRRVRFSLQARGTFSEFVNGVSLCSGIAAMEFGVVRRVSSHEHLIGVYSRYRMELRISSSKPFQQYEQKEWAMLLSSHLLQTISRCF